MKTATKRKILLSTVMVGIICIVIVVLTAYAAELRCDNNDLMQANKTVQGEIDTLNIKIKSASNIQHVEYVAIYKLGMSYPNEGQCIYISKGKTVNGNLASTIREQAYN